MLPSQIRRLIETLHSRLGLIHEALNKQESAVRDTVEAANERGREVAGVIASAIKNVGADVPDYEKSQRDKEYKLQNRLFWATMGAGLAAAIYAAIAGIQLGEMRKSTDAATSAACTAKRTLDLTRQMFEATQAAVFVSVYEMKTNPSHYPVWITVSIRNAGKTRATNIQGTIKLIRKTATGKVIEENERIFTRSVIAVDDGVTEAIGVKGNWNDLRGYLQEDFQVTTELKFDDGIQQIKQTFCRGPVMQRGTDTGASFAFAFEDCENIKTRKQDGY